MDNGMSSEMSEPFKDCYDDPVFDLDEDGEVIDYVEQPEFWAFEYLYEYGICE